MRTVAPRTRPAVNIHWVHISRAVHLPVHRSQTVVPSGFAMDARKFLQSVGSEVSSDFVKNRSILSFEEYIALFAQAPKQQARNAAQYLKDAIDHFGTDQVPHPTGKIRRFKIFDSQMPGDIRVAGQE